MKSNWIERVIEYLNWASSIDDCFAYIAPVINIFCGCMNNGVRDWAVVNRSLKLPNMNIDLVSHIEFKSRPQWIQEYRVRYISKEGEERVLGIKVEHESSFWRRKAQFNLTWRLHSTLSATLSLHILLFAITARFFSNVSCLRHDNRCELHILVFFKILLNSMCETRSVFILATWGINPRQPPIQPKVCTMPISSWEFPERGGGL